MSRFIQFFVLIEILTASICAVYFNPHVVQTVLYSEEKAMRALVGSDASIIEDAAASLIDSFSLPVRRAGDDEVQLGFSEADYFRIEAEWDAVASSPFMESLRLIGRLWLKRLDFFAMLNFLLLPLWGAVLVDAFTARRIRIASFVAPKPVVFKNSFGAAAFAAAFLLVLFAVPIGIPPYLWIAPTALLMLFAHVGARNFQKFIG